MERKKIRLDLSLYRLNNTYSLTVGTFNKQIIFLDSNVAKIVQTAIQDIHSTEHSLIAYVIMPNHVHLLIQIITGCDIISVIKLFKQKTGYWYKQKYDQPLWQKSFYDHIVREDESIEKVISYILNNPVRAGLIKYWQEYPFVGSGVWSRDELEEIFG